MCIYLLLPIKQCNRNSSSGQLVDGYIKFKNVYLKYLQPNRASVEESSKRFVGYTHNKLQNLL